MLLAACQSGATAAPTAGPTATPAGGTAAPSGTPAASATAGAALASTCQAAASEGSLVYWGSYSPEAFEKLTAPFKAAYPGINLSLLPQNPTEVVQRILTEVSANRQPAADVVGINPVLGAQIVDKGLVVSDVDWESLGVGKDSIRPDGPIRFYRAAYGLGYNTDLVKKEELPKTWDELLDPKWGNGQLIVSPAGFPFHILGLEWGRDKTVDYVRRVMTELKPTVINGTTAGTVNLASGATKLFVAARNVEIRENQAKGAPVEITYLDPIAGSDFFNYMLKSAPHPNAAKCWIGWLATPAGLKAQYDVEFKTNDSIPEGVPSNFKVLVANTKADLDLTNGILQEITPIITGKSN
jgi:iron(III) transport system substrate-binding protein